MFITILKLLGISLIPVAFASLIHALKIYTKFDQLKKHYQYAIIITLFSISCILGTVFGVESEAGAIINVRDASPIISGLMFGGPVGVVVGFVGGLYRFVSVYWGGSGAYTQLACSISTFMAGVFTLLVRRFIFNNHHGKWYYGLFLGILCEDFHMLLVILTHLNDIQNAYSVVTDVVAPMFITNSLAVAIAIIIADCLYKEKFFEGGRPFKISTKVQLALICCLVAAYGAVSSVSYFGTKNVALRTNEKSLSISIDDLTNDVDNLVDEKMRDICEEIKENIQPLLVGSSDLNSALASNLTSDDYQISEVHLVSKDNAVVYSSSSGVVNYDMNSNDQSKEFACLLGDTSFFSQNVMKPGSSEAADARMKYAGIKLDSNDKNLSYLQIGLNEETYHQLLDSKVKNSANYRHIGNKGFMIVAKRDGTIISTVDGSVVNDKIDTSELQLDTLSEFKGNTENASYYYYMYAREVEGYYVIALADVEEANLSSNIAFAILTLTEVFAFLILYCVLFVVIKNSVVNRIENVGKSLAAISQGDLSVKVNENNSKEMMKLSEDINATVESLKEYAKKEEEKMASELQFAKNIQHSALPTVFPLNNNFRVFANMITAKAVGGDFYDFYYVNQNHLAILVADVSGKGIPAAMFMMKSKTIIKGLVESGMPIHLAATEANKKLCEGNDANMFVTAWLGVVNIKTGCVEYVNAGHNPPLIQKENGEFEYLKSKKGFVFGGIDGFKYEKQSFELKPGEKIYLYTDGVTEATNKNHELYSEQRLVDAINDLSNKTPKEICRGIIESVNIFVGDAEQADDITMLCFQFIDQEKENSHVFNANIENTEEVILYVEKYLINEKCSPKAQMQINVAIDEIFSNICHYAYKGDDKGNVRISVSFDPTKENVTISFEDRGIPYNPLEKEDPDVESSLEDRKIGGLGIFIVKQTMDDVAYENDNGHNILTITKNIR